MAETLENVEALYPLLSHPSSIEAVLEIGAG
jgi:hypothetical protein